MTDEELFAIYLKDEWFQAYSWDEFRQYKDLFEKEVKHDTNRGTRKED